MHENFKEVFKNFKEITKNFKSEGSIEKDVKNLFVEHGYLKEIEHCSKAADKARALAIRFSENEDDAFCAGWLHDISAIFPKENRLKVAADIGLKILPEEEKFPAILHQKISEAMAKEIFGIKNEKILSAIGCHTTLKENASDFDKIIFIADKIEWDNEGEPPYKENVLLALDRSLDDAVFCYLDYLWKRRQDIAVVHPWMEAAYKQLLSKR